MQDYTEYEIFVMKVFQALSEDAPLEYFHQKKYLTRDGISLIIDVSFEFLVNNAYRIFGIIECKHYKSTVDIGKVRELNSKLNELGANKGIIVTTVGFQSGAIELAKKTGIGLAVIKKEVVPEGIVWCVRSFENEELERKKNTPHEFFQGQYYAANRGSSGYFLNPHLFMCEIVFDHYDSKEFNNWMFGSRKSNDI
jgi:predicted helicase